MKKIRITDECGNKYEVEEIVENQTEDKEAPVKDEDITANDLTEEEVATLKLLVEKANDILKLLDVKNEQEDACKDEEEGKEEENEEEDEEEEIVEEKKVSDSKKSFGSIEDSKKSVLDDSVDRQEVIANAWKNRCSKGDRK